MQYQFAPGGFRLADRLSLRFVFAICVLLLGLAPTVRAQQVFSGVGTNDATNALNAFRTALGANSRQAAAGLVTSSLRSGLIPLIDSTKTTGVVFFPGTMVGMLVAGAEPLDAVRLQLILLWTLLGAVAMSALVAVSLGYRGFFTPAHQLRELPSKA